MIFLSHEINFPPQIIQNLSPPLLPHPLLSLSSPIFIYSSPDRQQFQKKNNFFSPLELVNLTKAWWLNRFSSSNYEQAPIHTQNTRKNQFYQLKKLASATQMQKLTLKFGFFFRKSEQMIERRWRVKLRKFEVEIEFGGLKSGPRRNKSIKWLPAKFELFKSGLTCFYGLINFLKWGKFKSFVTRFENIPWSLNIQKTEKMWKIEYKTKSRKFNSQHHCQPPPNSELVT